jgi:hypothetical protein
MNRTTLNQAKKYSVSKNDIEEFATDKGYTVIGWEHHKRNDYYPTQDMLKVKFDTEEECETVVIEKTICPVCKEKAVIWGWADGEIYYSSCECKVLDIDNLD